MTSSASPTPKPRTKQSGSAGNPKVKRLGKGLSSLMAQAEAVVVPVQMGPAPLPPPKSEAPAPPASGGSSSPVASLAADFQDVAPGGLAVIDVHAIGPNPHQPRQSFDDEALATLAASIKIDGLMQPIVVRPAPDRQGMPYQLVAGERRLRAVTLAGLSTVPAVVHHLDDQQMAVWALIENLQRADLNPMERAEAFNSLSLEFSLSHEQIAGKVGLERSYVSNILRLLNLHESVQALVREGLLSMGQGRALAGLSDLKLQKALAKKAVSEDWSVRRTEQAARTAGRHDTAPAEPAKPALRQAHLRDLEEQIARQLHTKVRIRPGQKKGTGTLTIDFYSLDHFDGLLTQLGVKTD